MRRKIQVQGGVITNSHDLYEDDAVKIILVEHEVVILVNQNNTGKYLMKYILSFNPHHQLNYLRYHLDMFLDNGKYNRYAKITTARTLNQDFKELATVPTTVFQAVDDFLDSMELYLKMEVNDNNIL